MKAPGRLTALVLTAVLGASGLASCADDSSSKPTVAASFYPLAWVAEQVTGDRATVTNLTSPGTEPHDAELTVDQATALASAQVLLYEKGLQPSIDAAIANTSGETVEASEFASLMTPKGETNTDPHFWLDPTQLSKVAEGFTEVLAKADQDNADYYRARFGLLQRRLAELDRDWQRGLRQCTNRTIIVTHNSFEYVGQRYGLTVVPIAGLAPDAEPSTKQLAAVAKQGKDAQVTAIFTEPLTSPALADTLARQLGIKTAVLDPVEGVSADAKGDYISIMRSNLATLRSVNGCS